ncbi:hypothetical protein ACETK8_00205 [Brevundimonas staleyi]|uniref:MarR family transcriptional regulator n=1 Tax=Brevundimonas staleyi TaxID=74326 RepID=A0ABW0FS60_9CAUL
MTDTASLPPVHRRPGFAEAMRNSTHAPLALLDRDPGFYRCIGDIPTYAMGVLALHLHATDRLHHRGLREAARDLFSAGRASAILKRMQTAGLIVPLDDFRQGRQRRYGPAPEMVRAFRAGYLIELNSLAALDPRVGPMVETFEASDVFARIVGFLAIRHLAAPALDQELIEPLGGVGRRSMGLFLAYSLAETAFRAGRTRAEGTVEVNLSALARRLGISRTHSRRILTMLQEAGLVEEGETPNSLILTPAFADAYELYFLGMFSILLAAVGCWEG